MTSGSAWDDLRQQMPRTLMMTIPWAIRRSIAVEGSISLEWTDFVFAMAHCNRAFSCSTRDSSLNSLLHPFNALTNKDILRHSTPKRLLRLDGKLNWFGDQQRERSLHFCLIYSAHTSSVDSTHSPTQLKFRDTRSVDLIMLKIPSARRNGVNTGGAHMSQLAKRTTSLKVTRIKSR